VTSIENGLPGAAQKVAVAAIPSRFCHHFVVHFMSFLEATLGKLLSPQLSTGFILPCDPGLEVAWQCVVELPVMQAE